MKLDEAALVALHRELVRTPSVSGEEAVAIGVAAAALDRHGLVVERIGGSLLAWSSGAADAVNDGTPFVLFNSHLDTVPVCPGWTFAPHAAEIVGERIYGLGSNDAKASVAAMIAAAIAFAASNVRTLRLAVALVRDEERKSEGTAEIVAELARRGLTPSAVVVGEPTGLDFAVAQKGLLILELVARGAAAHAAHARSLGTRNAATELARDLVAIEKQMRESAGASDPLLGSSTVEPTILTGGTARNVVPAEARAILDCRTVPTEPPELLLARLAKVVEGELIVLSDRFLPVATDPDCDLVRAARRARPEAKTYGSATLSDMTWFAERPVIKAGPGESARSHRPDEFVTVGELSAGAAFYERLLGELAADAGAVWRRTRGRARVSA